MRTFYDGNKCCTVYTCPHCNYTYHEYTDYDEQLRTNEQPFIQLCEVLLFETADGRVNQLRQYACPECGILQIDTSDV